MSLLSVVKHFDVLEQTRFGGDGQVHLLAHLFIFHTRPQRFHVELFFPLSQLLVEDRELSGGFRNEYPCFVINLLAATVNSRVKERRFFAMRKLLI